MLVAFDAFFHFVTTSSCSFVLVITSIPDLSVLPALQCLVYLANIDGTNTVHLALSIVVCLSGDSEAIRQLDVAVCLQVSSQGRTCPIEIGVVLRLHILPRRLRRPPIVSCIRCISPGHMTTGSSIIHSVLGKSPLHLVGSSARRQ